MEKNNSVFSDKEELESLFDDLSEDLDTTDDEIEELSLMSDEEDDDEDNDNNDDDKDDPKVVKPSLFDDSEKEVIEDEEEKELLAQSYKGVLDTLIEKFEEFDVLEDHEERKSYTADEFIYVITENINNKSQTLAQNILDNAVAKLSPAVQKVVIGELNDVSLKELMQEASLLEELDSLPKNPTDIQKETLVRKYYLELAKEKNKDNQWVSNKIMKILKNDELDEEYDEAVSYLEEVINKKIEDKAKEKELKQLEKREFIKTHKQITNEILNEENIFGLKLSKEEKDNIANVLTSFVTRPKDSKEKLGITALIDTYIHSNQPKESYKKLVLMTLAAIKPDALIKKLKNASTTEVTKETHINLKTANRKTPISLTKTNKKKKQLNSVFDKD